MNGFITYSPDTTIPYNYQTMVTYGCNSGYGLLGGDTVRICVESSLREGEWSGTTPTCEGIIIETCNIM